MNGFKLIKLSFVGLLAGLAVQAANAATITSISSTIERDGLQKIGKLKNPDRINVTFSDGSTLTTKHDSNLKTALPMLQAGGINISHNGSGADGEPSGLVGVIGPGGSQVGANKIGAILYRVTRGTGLVATGNNIGLLTNALLVNMATSALVSGSNVVATTYPGQLAVVYQGSIVGFFAPNTIIQTLTVSN